jgi:hypothetical protein
MAAPVSVLVLRESPQAAIPPAIMAAAPIIANLRIWSTPLALAPQPLPSFDGFH